VKAVIKVALVRRGPATLQLARRRQVATTPAPRSRTASAILPSSLNVGTGAVLGIGPMKLPNESGFCPTGTVATTIFVDVAITETLLDGGSVVTATTLVRLNNLFGRVYLTAIMPFHKAIVRTMLKGMAIGIGGG
jgi:hypothetical protein